MPYSLKTAAGSILNGKTVTTCLLLDQDGTTVVDLAGNTITVGASVVKGTTPWLSGGTTIPWVRGAGSTSTHGITWNTYPAARPTADVTYYIISLAQATVGDGVATQRALLTLLNAGASARINIQTWGGTDSRLGLSQGSSVTVSRTGVIPSTTLPVAYKVKITPGGVCTLGQVVGGGASAPTAFSSETPSDGATLTTTDTRLDQALMVNTAASNGDNVGLILGVVGGLSAAEETTLLADPIVAVAQSGGGAVATLAGSLDTITGAITAGAGAITADLNGALDTITGAVLVGAATGRLTSALPLRDAARVMLANRADVAVHVVVKPGLGSVIVLSAQAIVSGIWTAAGPFTVGNRYNVLYEVGGEPIGCEIITAAPL